MALVYGLLGWIATFWPAVLHVYFDLFSGGDPDICILYADNDIYQSGT